MTIKKPLPFVFNLVIILTLLLVMLFIQPASTSSRLHRTNMATSIEVSRYKNEGDTVGRVEDSARRVPTGPDPLHHNNNPIRP